MKLIIKYVNPGKCNAARSRVAIWLFFSNFSEKKIILSLGLFFKIASLEPILAKFHQNVFNLKYF
jgi:hypothetical protein